MSGRESRGWASCESYVDTLVGEAWWNGGGFLFGFAKEDRELLDGGHGDITAVVSGQQGLSSNIKSATHPISGRQLCSGRTLPLRSRKKSADAMVMSGLGGQGGCGGKGGTERAAETSMGTWPDQHHVREKAA